MFSNERVGNKKLFGIPVTTKFLLFWNSVMDCMVAFTADVDCALPHLQLREPLFEPNGGMTGSGDKMMLANVVRRSFA